MNEKLKTIFYDLMSDAEFRNLVLDNYEITPFLMFHTDLNDVECSEMENFADIVYKGAILD